MPRHVPAITAEQILEADRRGLSYAQTAELYNVSEKCVWRARRRAGLAGKPTEPITEAELARAEILNAEKMPLNWVAEDLGRNASNLRRILRPGQNAEWKSVWGTIRYNPEMLELHRQFAPKQKWKK